MRTKNPGLARYGALMTVLAIAGCTTDRHTDPPMTATEQLLVSTAVDRSLQNINFPIPAGSKVFIDPQYFDVDGGVRTKYTIAAVRDTLLRKGLLLVDDRKSADTIVELRSGAQSINDSSFLIGIPSFPVPVPLAGTLQFPEIAFFKIERETGISKLELTAYGNHSGALVASSGTDWGQASRRTYIIFPVSWTNNEVEPPAPPK
jgi:hypothetical protein